MLRDKFDDSIEEFRMKEMPPIDKASLAKVSIVEVENHIGIIQVNIEDLNEVNKEVIEGYLLKPVKLIMMTHRFVKHKE
jgi:hypothetical protein